MLENPYARGRDWYEAQALVHTIGLLRDAAEEQWEFVTRTLAAASMGFERPEAIELMAARVKASMTPAEYYDFRAATEALDVSDALPRIRVPAVVAVAHGSRLEPVGAEVAALIPDARLVSLDSTTYIGEALIDEVAGRTPDRGRTAHDHPRAAGTAVILFTDIADSTGLTERMGDAAFRTVARALDDSLRTAIRDAGGSPVAGKVLGDGVMGVFVSAAEAIAAAGVCVAAAAAAELPLHIGVHAGDVIREDDGNVYGGAVNIAARICALCEPGEILVTDIVRGLARTPAGVTFEDRGEHALKGIADPVRVFAVWPGD